MEFSLFSWSTKTDNESSNKTVIQKATDVLTPKGVLYLTLKYGGFLPNTFNLTITYKKSSGEYDDEKPALHVDELLCSTSEGTNI